MGITQDTQTPGLLQPPLRHRTACPLSPGESSAPSRDPLISAGLRTTSAPPAVRAAASGPGPRGAHQRRKQSIPLRSVSVGEGGLAGIRFRIIVPPGRGAVPVLGPDRGVEGPELAGSALLLRLCTGERSRSRL